MLIMVNCSLEITRNCNIRCAHCFKGEARDENIDLRVLSKIFNPNTVIQNLEFSGGEVFLRPEIFTEVVNFIINSGVILLHANIITNGTCYNQKIEESLKKLNIYIKKCQQLTLVRMNSIDVELSVDTYHQEELKKIKDINPQLYKEYKSNILNLINSEFFSDYRDNEEIIDKGRAKNLNNIKKYKPYQSKLYYFVSGSIMEASGVGVNVNGYVKKTTNGSLFENDLVDIIKNNGISCMNEVDFNRKYKQNIDNMKHLQLVKK